MIQYIRCTIVAASAVFSINIDLIAAHPTPIDSQIVIGSEGVEVWNVPNPFVTKTKSLLLGISLVIVSSVVAHVSASD